MQRTLKEQLKLAEIDAEREYLAEVLRESRGKVSVAMSVAGWRGGETKFYRKLYSHELYPARFRK